MANKLLSMNKIRQILLFLERGTSQRSIEKEMNISRKTISVYRQKFLDTGKTFLELLKHPDSEIEALLGLNKSSTPTVSDPRRIHFDSLLAYFDKELKDKVGVTRFLLWEEYIKEYPAGFHYSRFCELLQEFKKVNSAVMYFTHTPGKLLEVDFAGDMLHYVDYLLGK